MAKATLLTTIEAEEAGTITEAEVVVGSILHSLHLSLTNNNSLRVLHSTLNNNFLLKQILQGLSAKSVEN
jgi:hypothetical protein